MPPISRILFATDLTASCEEAFAYAVRLALHWQGSLEILHCSNHTDSGTLRRLPKVRPLLIRWGLLPAGARHQDVTRLGLNIRKQVVAEPPVPGITHETAHREIDLLVLGSHARSGWSRMLSNSVANQAIQSSHLPGLIVPGGAHGFLNHQTGSLNLRRILIPVATRPRPERALQLAIRLAQSLANESGQLHTIHIGEREGRPELPETPPGWEWQHHHLEGEAVPQLTRFASEWKPDLVVMTSQGADSWRDRWLGSTCEQLLSQLATPVLVVPAR